MDGDLVRVDAVGSVGLASRVGVAWRADAALGDRAVRGIADVREASRTANDAAAVLETRVLSSAVVHSGVMATGLRGRERMRWGPVVSADAFGTLGSGSAWGSSWQAMGAFRVIENGGSGLSQVGNAGIRLFGGGWVGLARLAIDGQGLFVAMGGEEDAMGFVVAPGAEVSVPLVRGYLLSHWVEPFARAQVVGVVGNAREDGAGSVVDDSGWLSTAGVRNALGKTGGESGLRLEVSGGAVGVNWSEKARPVFASSIGLRAGVLTVRGQGAVVEGAGSWGGFAMGRGMVGGVDTVGLFSDVAVVSRVDVSLARASMPMEFGGQPFGVLMDDGVSLMVGGRVPVGGGVRFEAVTDWDVADRRWVALGTGLVLDHRCGCLQGRVWVSRRVGRDGTDGWFGVMLK